MDDLLKFVTAGLVGAVISGISSAIYFGRRQCRIHCPYLTDKQLIDDTLKRLRTHSHDLGNKLQADVYEPLARHEVEITKLGILLTKRRGGL